MAFEYADLLEKALKDMPKKTTSGERFECPVADLFVEGTKTQIRNFDVICSKLRRKPEDIMKYFTKELAVRATVEGGKLVLQGKFVAKTVNDRIQAYCQSNVICRQCGKPDTHLDGHDRHIRTMVCEACGAKTPVSV